MKTITIKYNLKSNKISNVKIAHISDIHYSHKYKIERFKIIVDELKKINPQYICITGDLIDSDEMLEDKLEYNIFIKFIKELSQIGKVLITLGNHEMKHKINFSKDKYMEIVNKFKNIDNVIILENEAIVLDKINFIGFNPSNEYYDKKGKNAKLLVDYFNEQQFSIKDNYNILLIHTPKDLLKDKIYNEIKSFNKIDLILAGHTHGGLMPNNIKGHCGIISPGKKILPRDVRGCLIRNNTNLIISSGIIRLSDTSHLNFFNDLYAMSINEITIN
ncbi:MAG: metallophosphoesterase [Clostridia bacterium]